MGRLQATGLERRLKSSMTRSAAREWETWIDKRVRRRREIQGGFKVGAEPGAGHDDEVAAGCVVASGRALRDER